MPQGTPTRQRLLDGGMALFAERGFRTTTVGDIEAAVGLQPRRGALYRHFPSKEALLEEVAQRYIESVSISASQIEQVPIPPGGVTDPSLLRPMLRALGRWMLDSLDQQRDVFRLLEHDGHRLDDLVERMRAGVVDTGNKAAAHLLASAVPDLDDPEGYTVMLLSSLTGLRRTTWTFGGPPLGIDDARALDRWVDLVIAFASTALQK